MPCPSTPSQIKSISPLATPNQSHSPISDRLERTRVKYLTLGQHRMQQPHLCHFEVQLARHSRYRWVPRFAESYSQFLVALVSTLPKYLHEVTNKLIQEFDSPNTTHHHEILTKIIKYVPTSINSIPQLLQKLPHHISSSTKELTNYVQNLVRVLDYTPELQFSIWQLIIESSIKLDVELQNELDDLTTKRSKI